MAESPEDILVFDVRVDPVEPSTELASGLDFSDCGTKFVRERDQLFVVAHPGDELLKSLGARSFFLHALFGYLPSSVPFGLFESLALLLFAILLFCERGIEQANDYAIQLLLKRSIFAVSHDLFAEPLFNAEFELT